MEQTKKAAIIGGGVIGGGWAARFLLNGWDVSVFDLDSDAMRKIGEVLDNARLSLPSLADVPMPQEGKLLSADTLKQAVAGAHWIQESVPERLDIKHKVLGDIQTECAPEAIIGSSTSGFEEEGKEPCILSPGSTDQVWCLCLAPVALICCWCVV